MIRYHDLSIALGIGRLPAPAVSAHVVEDCELLSNQDFFGAFGTSLELWNISRTALDDFVWNVACTFASESLHYFQHAESLAGAKVEFVSTVGHPLPGESRAALWAFG